VTLGASVKLGYFAQHTMELLDPGQTVLETLQRNFPLATLGSPLETAPGRNRTVEACRAVAWGEAQKLGAREIEAVSAGPDRPNGKGGFVGPVRMRITYARPDGYEVRLADMTCVVDRSGRIVDAHV